ncbi:MAG: MoxR family ATPase [Deltaproteobacteria bacterium]|jgi:MoxR-like ATPase|nr:MoxR family ATPase [Deltaproteobacteria bacterium]
MDLALVGQIVNAIRAEIRKVIVGQEAAVDLLLTSLLAGGHALLEGAPGTGKTLLAQTFAQALGLKFGRVQFTPDMTPGDILGTNLFNFQTNEFSLTPGPIFTEILLADEINRTPPKTQAALLQAMNERSVTIDRQTYELGDDFMVVATQNPIEHEGTYPLPEAQLDRFLFKIKVDYPQKEEEEDIARRHGHIAKLARPQKMGVAAAVTREHIAHARSQSAQVTLSEPLVAYIVDIVRATRAHPLIETGASPRASSVFAASARARAALLGRDFAIPDDVKFLALPLLRHRLALSPSADIEGAQADQLVADILSQLPAPR